MSPSCPLGKAMPVRCCSYALQLFERVTPMRANERVVRNRLILNYPFRLLPVGNWKASIFWRNLSRSRLPIFINSFFISTHLQCSPRHRLANIFKLGRLFHAGIYFFASYPVRQSRPFTLNSRPVIFSYLSSAFLFIPQQPSSCRARSAKRLRVGQQIPWDSRPFFR